MIELNLLPEEHKKKKKKLELPEIPIVPIAAIAVGILVILQLLFSGLAFMCKNQLSSLEKTWQELAPVKTELDAIKSEIKVTGKKTRAIEKLIQKRFSWARLMNELGNSLSANIWLTGLTYQENAEARALRISGSSSARGEEATRDIARFIKALKGNGNFFGSFYDIELVSIKKGAVAGGQDLMNCTIVCKFKPEEAG